MNGKQIALGIVLADFVALTGYVLWSYGLIGFFEQELANAATILGLTDLTIALSMIAVWMWLDAKKRGISAVPYIAATAVLGSAGPLAYLIRIVASESRHPIGAAARSVA